MNGKYLLDTIILVALFAIDESIKTRLTEAAEVFIPSIAIGGLFYGAWKSHRVQGSLEQVEDPALETPVLGYGIETDRLYGRIKHSLRLKGRPIPENDLWIAAIAMEHDLTLVTRDAHLTAIADLRIVVWKNAATQ